MMMQDDDSTDANLDENVPSGDEESLPPEFEDYPD